MAYHTKLILGIMAVLSCIIVFNTDCPAQPFGISPPQSQQIPQQGALSSAMGRYVFGQISDSGKDKFMLDTWTGRLWRIGESGGIGLYLSAIPYRDEKGGKTSFLPEKMPGEADAGPEKR